MKKNQKIVAIVQARYNSTRLQGKVLKKINDLSAIEILHKRITKSQIISDVIIATSKNAKNKPLINLLKKKKYKLLCRR
tara:strand:+ start:845 stop:1081 length:237 start_codon:yes stop_codon:yes gene_type:complete